MAHFSELCNNSDADNNLKPLAEDQDEKLETTLEVISDLVSSKSFEEIKESPINHWMDIASPILKSGGKPVTIILALGFISIPLMVSGSPWVALTLAIGASATAICSCFSFN